MENQLYYGKPMEDDKPLTADEINQVIENTEARQAAKAAREAQTGTPPQPQTYDPNQLVKQK